MNCPNCNKEIKDDSKFCEFCGTPIQGNSEGAAQPVQSQEPVNPAQPQAGQVMPPKKAPMDKKTQMRIGIIAAAVVLVLVVAVVLIKTHKTKIDLQDYAKVNFSGYDKYGKAELDFDNVKFMKDFAEAAGIGDDLEDYESISDLYDLDKGDLKDITEAVAIFEEITTGCKLDKESGLKNGDTVKLTFKFDNDKAKEFGVKFVGDDLEVKASGLKEVKEIDPFQDVKVEFSGTSPDVSVSVENESQEEGISGLYFKAEPDDDLKVGDKVKVTVDYDEDSFIEEYGCILKVTEKEYTVEKVDAYLTAANELNDDVVARMKTQTENTIKAYFATEKEELKQSNLKYVGYYFMSNIHPDGWNPYNQVYMVYSAKVKSKSKSFKTSTVYLPVKFTNVIKYADGTLYVDTDSDSIEGHSGLSYSWWSEVKGYRNEADMKEELVTSQKANYNDESVDGLK